MNTRSIYCAIVVVILCGASVKLEANPQPLAGIAIPTPTGGTFNGTATPSELDLTAGSAGEYHINVESLNGFSGDVSLTVAGLPTGTTAMYSPSAIKGGAGTSTLTIHTSAFTRVDAYSLTLTGTSGSISRSLMVTLVVNEALQDFTASIEPQSALIGVGESAAYTIQLIPINGFIEDVALSVTGVPTGATAKFNPAIILGGSGTSVLTVTSSPGETPSNNVLTLTGTSPLFTHSTTLVFQVSSTADFTGSVTPSVDSVLVGGKADYTATVSPLHGFTGNVALNVLGLPTGASATTIPSTIAGGSGSSAVTITTTAATPPGAYILTMTGTSGTLIHDRTFQLNVNTSVGDFTGSVSPHSETVAASASTTYSISISPLAGFNGDVTLSASNLPPNTTASFSPSNVIAGGSGSATATVATTGGTPAGTFPIVFIGTSGGISHDASVNLVVTPFQTRPFPGDFFFRLPNQNGGSLVPSEAYDPALKELFVSNPGINTVEVYSTVDGHHVGAISVPGPAGLSFSPDGSKLVIGTITPYIYFANPMTLHITSQLQIPTSLLTNAQDGSNLLPVMPYAMADGTIFIGMGLNSVSSSSSIGLVEHLILYDPANGTFTPKDPGVGGSIGNPGLSLDGTHLLVGGLTGTSIALFLYTTDAQAYVAESGSIPNEGISIEANPNGSQFACVFAGLGAGTLTTQVNFFGANLQPQFQFTSPSSPSLPGAAVFSRDGKYLFVSGSSSVTALNTLTGTPAGYVGVTGPNVFGNLPFFDVDERYRLFSAAELGGVLILNAAQLQASPPGPLPVFTTITDVGPESGPLAGGTQVQFIPAPFGSGSADGISNSMEAYFGSVPAPQDFVSPDPGSSDGENILTATSPPAVAPGPVTVFLTDANNDLVFLPDAFTYGPHLLRVIPNGASSQGGDTTTVYYYGPGISFPEPVQVSIGGNTANPGTTQEFGIPLNGFPEQSIGVIVPPGTPGWADITLTTSDGTDTLKRSFQYLKEAVNVAGGPFEFAVYDPIRDRFYLTGFNNTVAVFDAASRSFLAPLPSPAAVSSGAVLQGEALTPDSSKLLVADATDNLVLIFDLAGGTSTTVSAMLPGDPTSTIFGPPQTVFVATAAQNRAFVSIQPCIPNPVREINLTNLSVRARPDAASTCTTYVPNPENGASSADGGTIVYAGNSGNEPPGAEYVWRYDASSDKFTGPVLIQNAPYIGAFDAAVDGDGSVIAVTQGTLDQRLLPLVPSVAFGGTAWAMNKTGSLIYSVIGSFSPPTGVLISDSQNFRELLIVGLPTGLPATFIEGARQPLAIDPTGQKILALTQSGVSYFELSVIPLAVGTISPSQVSAGGSITVRGSGFVSGTTVKIGGLSTSCTVTDSETLSCTVPSVPAGAAPMSLANPDGQTYSFENALTVK